MTKFVWVFNHLNSNFPSGVFSSEDKARAWIRRYSLKGTLTQYPIDLSAYDYATQNGFFTPKNKHHFDDEFVGRFTNANNQHYHFD